MNYLFKLAKRLSVAHWQQSGFPVVAPLVPSSLDPHDLLEAVILLTLLRWGPAACRALGRAFIFKMIVLTFPNRRRWSVPTGSPRRWTDSILVHEFELPQVRGRYPLVY